MPTRDQMSSAIVTEHLTGSPDYVVSRKAYGVKQTISALNNAGMWVPGVLRLNPVVIERWTGTGIAATFTPLKKVGTTPFLVEGDIAAWLASNAETLCQAYAGWDSTMASYSMAKAYSKMSEPDFDVGMILVELDETIHGLFNPLSALRKFIQDFNKLKSLRRYPNIKISYKNERSPEVLLSDTLSMLSGSWLEWRYGITPLIIAIESAIKHFKDLAQALQGKLLRKRGKVEKEQSMPNYTYGAYPGYCGFSGVASIERKIKTVTSLYFNFTQPVTWQERYGLDILNAPALVWERIPLSFVLDWFLGVGLWLQSLHLSDKRNVVGSCTSQKTTVTLRMPDTNVYWSVPATNYNCGSSYVMTYEKLDRRVNQTPPLLPVVNPAFLSLQRRLDAATLIWQRLPKFRR